MDADGPRWCEGPTEALIASNQGMSKVGMTSLRYMILEICLRKGRLFVVLNQHEVWVELLKTASSRTRRIRTSLQRRVRSGSQPWEEGIAGKC